jgi:uncharacterized protein (TIGR00255 family)
MLSMTGYGRSHVNRDGRDLLLELKTVNHRFLDVSFRMPKTLTFLEDPLRALIARGEIKRGHVDVTIVYQNHRPDANLVTIDQALLEQCALKTSAMAQMLQLTPLTMSELLTASGALTVTPAEEDACAVTALATDAYAEAIEQLKAMRLCEGEALAADLSANLLRTEELTQQIAARAPAIPQSYRERLEARMAEWKVQTPEPQRIAQEVATMADRCAIDEELARLQSHFEQFRACLIAKEETGRKMDFLLQEMNREVNTVGSKASDLQITGCVVEMKCLLEKLREQVQNVA